MSAALSWVAWVALVNALLACAACAAVWCVGRAGGRPALVHALWLVVIARLLVPPVVGVPLLPPVDLARWTDMASLDAVMPLHDPVLADPGAPGSGPVVDAITVREPTVSKRTFGLGIIGLSWLTGSALIAWNALRRRRRMARLLGLAAPAPDAVTELAIDLARDLQLSRCPPIVIVPGRVSPMVWCAPRGLCVVLPNRLLRRLPRGGVESVLAHELAHVRRRDHWTRRVELVATVLCWWAPALWWARAGLRRAEERCCDLWVVRVRPGLAGCYARTLVETAAFISESNGRTGRLPALASGAAPVRHLKERVTMIMRNNRPATSSSTSTLQRVALAAVALAALAVAPAAIESTAGEPLDRDALSDEAALERTVVELQQQIEELAEYRRALAAEIEMLQRRRLELDASASARERDRLLAEQELLRAELLRMREREELAGRDNRTGSRELARALALDARVRADEMRGRASLTRRAYREQLDALRAEVNAERDPRTRDRLDRQIEKLELLIEGLATVALNESNDRMRAVHSALEAKILELEAAGHVDQAERLRRELEQMKAR